MLRVMDSFFSFCSIYVCPCICAFADYLRIKRVYKNGVQRKVGTGSSNMTLKFDIFVLGGCHLVWLTSDTVEKKKCKQTFVF